MPVVDVNDEALGSTSSSTSSKPTNKHVSNADKKLFSESAKSKKIFSKKNHQDSAPELLEGAAARLSGDPMKRTDTFTSSKVQLPSEACLVSLSDPCSPIASPVDGNESNAVKPYKLNKTYDLRGLTPNTVGNKNHLLPVGSDARSDDGSSVKPKTEAISLIAARRGSRVGRADGGRLSISVNDLTEVGRSNQTGSSMSYVSDNVLRTNTNQNPGRQDATYGGAKKKTRERSPDEVSVSTVKSKNVRNQDRRRRAGVAPKNAFEANGVDSNRPWRQNQQPNRRLKPPNAGGRIWFPRDQGKDKNESLQPLHSREAAESTVGQNNAYGNGLTVVRRNRPGFHHANASSSNNSTPAGHQGAPAVPPRKRNVRGMNAPAGFTSNRSSQQNNTGNAASNNNNNNGDGSGEFIAVTGHALRNGDPF